MKSVFILLVAILSGSLTLDAHAGGAATHLSTASEQSVASVGNVSMATAKIVSATVAMPLQVVGASGQAGDELWEFANTPVGTALPIDAAVHTVGPPPDTALRNRPMTSR